MPSDMLREVWLGLKRFWALGGIIKVPILAAIAFLAVAIIAGAVGGDDEGDDSTNVASDWTPTTSLSSLSSLSPSQLIERFKITPLALPTFGPRDLSRFWLTTATPSASQAGGQSQPTTEAPASPESVPSTEASAPLVPQAETPSPASPTQPPPQSPSLAELQPVPQQGYDECLQECEDSFFACVDNEDRCELERSQCQHDAEWVCGEAESSCQDDCDQDEDACVAACDLAASTCRRDCEASWDALFYFCLDMCTDEFEMVDVDCHDESAWPNKKTSTAKTTADTTGHHAATPVLMNTMTARTIAKTTLLVSKRRRPFARNPSRAASPEPRVTATAREEPAKTGASHQRHVAASNHRQLCGALCRHGVCTLGALLPGSSQAVDRARGYSLK